MNTLLTLRLGPIGQQTRHAAPDVSVGSQILDLVEAPDGQSDKALIEKIVVNHWSKLEQRTAQENRKPYLSKDAMLAPTNEVENGQLSKLIFHSVNAQRHTCVKRLPFSTVSFVDEHGVPHILIAHQVSFHAAVISAFNSCLDIINLRQRLASDSSDLDAGMVFRGLNSQPIEVVINDTVVPGYLRTATPDYVL